ncbi:hypothetical protein GPL17_18725 [Bradyrhizobium yuanmingense]|uniref:hypothetical protein n=1 Tax=Bradyrhizobium yuanmingense TaxID=108015 RepID=UPI0012FABF7B|nr:hypothetical protein [Bradyrhizobium yuanmingense]MVT52518.1 hypothetical protein [Bradyrhizobium yuanmingense]
MIKITLMVSIFYALTFGPAFACPDGQSKGAFGWCYPNIGGEVGKAWEKGKTEIANFERDIRTWIETGVCGGDICDAFAAAAQFAEDQVSDFGESLKQAQERLSEGKPLDALWHLQMDYFVNTEENAADAAFRSRVLLATGQVAASVYGGPGGAAGYTAWLAYNSTKNVGDALKAGLISGAASAALGAIDKIDISSGAGVPARAILTGAVAGAAVAASGGTQEEVRAAFGMGAAAVLIREGYRRLTKLELNRERLKSSTGEAYCLAEIPPADYLTNLEVPQGCLGPRSAYTKGPDGSAVLDRNGRPEIDFKRLDPDRPHVGVWAEAKTSPFNQVAENSKFMTGVSRLPGWNAMAVAHDEFSAQMKFDLIPGGLGMIPTVASIPPAVVMTYVGTGSQVHDSIRQAFQKRSAEEGRTFGRDRDVQVIGRSRADSTYSAFAQGPTETLHLICGRQAPEHEVDTARTDIIVNVSIDRSPRGGGRRLCEIRQTS